MNLEKLKEKTKILDYAEEQGHRPRKITATEYRLNPCPVCGGNDHFTIYTETNSFSSFSECCKGGSIIDYFIEVEKMDQAQAIKKLKEINGFRDESETSIKSGRSNPADEFEPKKEGKKDHSVLLEKARKNGLNCEYYYNRGLSEKTINQYGLGYLPGGSGIFEKKFKFIIPVSKNFVVMRSDDDDDRYRNLGNTELFNKRYLQDPSLTVKKIFVTEGLFDALTLEEMDFSAISLNGNSMAGTFLEELESNKGKLQDKLFALALDSDQAGQETQGKLKDGLRELGMAYTELDLKGYKDINKFYLQEPQGLRDSIELMSLRGTNYEYLQSAFFEEQQKRRNEKEITTGLLSLNSALGGGFYPGLYVLGSVTSLGKSALALQLADRVAADGHNVLFFSLEMSRYEMVCRSLAREVFLRDPKNSINTGRILRGEEHLQIHDALDYYKENVAPDISIIESNFDTDIENLRIMIKEQTFRSGKPPVVFVDYLQVLRPLDMRMTEKQSVDYNVVELKRLSRDLDIPVIAVSSFNRMSYNGPAVFEAFKESGSVEYTADVVLAMQLRGKKEKDSAEDLKNREPRPLELVILKNRRGRAYEVIPLDYWPKYNYFMEVEGN